MEVLILTGMSGSGKTKCLKILEDLGYLCVDNIMPSLIPEVVKTCDAARSTAAVARLAVSVDVRGGVFFEGIYAALDRLKSDGYLPRVLFLDSSDDVLCNRYKETRREHPLSTGGRVVTGIRKERELLTRLRAQADFYLDTSYLGSNELRQKVYDLLPDRRMDKPAVILISFGLKRGIPMDADIIYDVRYLPNPFHEPSLKDRNGTQDDVVEYIFRDPLAEDSLLSFAAQIEKILPSYLARVKTCLVVGVGCTGGKHRSVACAERLARIMSEHGIAVNVEHRDLYKE